MFKHTKTTKKTKVSFFNLFLTRKTELNSSMHFWHHYALKQIPLFALSLSRDCWKRDNKLSRTLSLTLLNAVGPSLTHTNTCTYFFLVPKDDDDDDETLFDLGLLFLWGKRTENRAPKLPIDFSRPFLAVPCPPTGTSGGRRHQLTICANFGPERAK